MHEKALETMKRIGDEACVATTYGNLAISHETLGDVAQALGYFHKSLEITERIGDRHTSANTYFNLGTVCLRQGDREQARVHLEKAKALYEIVGDARGAQQAAQELRGL